MFVVRRPSYFMNETPENSSVQQTAKQVLAEIMCIISPDSSEQSIISFAIDRLSQYELTQTWYYDCPALVLLGSRSCLTISGRDYTPGTELVGQTNRVTVDLSPLQGTQWGDCARSFVIEDGSVVSTPSRGEFQRGIDFVANLHKAMRRFVTCETRICELYHFANDFIASERFENLDFLGNIGHSIATSLDGRIFLDATNHRTLGSIRSFTFEPHVRELGGRWGFKHEDIYYFDQSGTVVAL